MRILLTAGLLGLLIPATAEFAKAQDRLRVGLGDNIGHAKSPPGSSSKFILTGVGEGATDADLRNRVSSCDFTERLVQQVRHPGFLMSEVGPEMPRHLVCHRD
jgi:hypothetical protein